MAYAPYRGAIRRERPAFQPALRPPTNFLPFLSGSGESASEQIPLVGIWLGAAGNSSTEYGYTKTCTTKRKGQKSPWLKFLKVLRKLLSRSFLSGFGQSPRSYDLGQSPKVFFYHFYPVAERAQANKSRWTGFGSEQPGIAARNMATFKIRTTKSIKIKIQLG